MKVNGKHILITGAGSGIGRELSLQLADKGAKLALIDIDESKLEETAALCGKDKCTLHALSVADRQAVESLAKNISSSSSPVDGLINNAGIIQPFVDVESMEYEDIERIMKVNFYGSLYLIKAFLPMLKTRPEAHIVNVSSMGGFMPFPRQTIYGASKAALKLLTEGLYAELNNTSVKVSVVYPGAIDTNIMSNSGLSSPEEEKEQKEKSEHKALPAAQAAAQIINGMEKDKFRILVGKDAKMMNFLYRLAPTRSIDFIVKKMGKMDL